MDEYYYYYWVWYNNCYCTPITIVSKPLPLYAEERRLTMVDIVKTILLLILNLCFSTSTGKLFTLYVA